MAGLAYLAAHYRIDGTGYLLDRSLLGTYASAPAPSAAVTSFWPYVK